MDFNEHQGVKIRAEIKEYYTFFGKFHFRFRDLGPY